MPERRSKKRSGSQSTNPQPILIQGGEEPDSLAEITRDYSTNSHAEPLDFQERVVMSYYGAVNVQHMPRYVQSPQMAASLSVAPSVGSSSRQLSYRPSSQYSASTASAYSAVPSLTRSAASTSSSASYRSADYAAVTGLIGEDGVVRSNNMPCDFSFLGCDRHLPVGRAWRSHSRYHLGVATPPTEVSCPARDCPWSESYADGEEAWEGRCSHILSEHTSPGDWGGGWRRPGKNLLQHLYNNRIIATQEFRDLLQTGHTRVSSYSVNHGERDDRRREPRSPAPLRNHRGG